VNCAAFEEQIARYVGGDLSPEDAALVTQHLRECSGCAELARDLEADSEWLSRRPHEVTEVDYTAMRGRIRAEISQSRSKRRWLPGLVAAAAVLLVIAILPRRSAKVPVRVVEPTAAVAQAPQPAAAAAPLPAPVARPRRQAKRFGAPPPDGALEIAMRMYQALDVQAPSAAMPEPPVEMQIATHDPDVRIMLVPENNGDSR